MSENNYSQKKISQRQYETLLKSLEEESKKEELTDDIQSYESELIEKYRNNQQKLKANSSEDKRSSSKVISTPHKTWMVAAVAAAVIMISIPFFDSPEPAYRGTETDLCSFSHSINSTDVGDSVLTLKGSCRENGFLHIRILAGDDKLDFHNIAITDPNNKVLETEKSELVALKVDGLEKIEIRWILSENKNEQTLFNDDSLTSSGIIRISL
ncbi:MAG: hypothetical protein HRU19_30295 [Pseudobacteriovorax sp.]|nr:hypothetical protein [Pseudobacteriovorax sp.]